MFPESFKARRKFFLIPAQLTAHIRRRPSKEKQQTKTPQRQHHDVIRRIGIYICKEVHGKKIEDNILNA